MAKKLVYTAPKCEMYSINSQDICDTTGFSFGKHSDDNDAWGDSSDDESDEGEE